MSSDQLVEFANLKRKIYEAARNALLATNPKYVDIFLRRFEETSGDLDQVIDETRPLLVVEGFKKWTDLLTAILDVELATDKVKRSLQFLARDVAGSPEDTGAWAVYHVDHWILQMDALLERLDKLVAKVFRQIIKSKDPDWQNKQGILRGDIKKLKGEIAKRRDPLAHGGGEVEGIQKDQLWEPMLVQEVFDVAIVQEYYQRVGPRRQLWHSHLKKSTIYVLATTEAIAERLSGYIG